MTIVYTIPGEWSGFRLESVLRSALHISANLIRQTKRDRLPILLDGAPVFTNQPVSTGQIVEVTLPGYPLFPPETDFASEQIPLPAVRILYEDSCLVIVWKPPFLQTHPSSSRPRCSDTLELRLQRQLHVPVHPVHRLDFETSGISVFSKEPYIQSVLQKQMGMGLWKKTYRAIVFGTPVCETGIIDRRIERIGPDSFTRRISETGQEAVTRYRVVLSKRIPHTNETASLLSLEPVTGRTHQLRVHLQSIGCPILGDKRYATYESTVLSAHLGLHRQQLCATGLQIQHPVTGEAIRIDEKDDLLPGF